MRAPSRPPNVVPVVNLTQAAQSPALTYLERNVISEAQAVAHGGEEARVDDLGQQHQRDARVQRVSAPPIDGRCALLFRGGGGDEHHGRLHLG